jgi:excisionase family DNA binding protein
VTPPLDPIPEGAPAALRELADALERHPESLGVGWRQLHVELDKAETDALRQVIAALTAVSAPLLYTAEEAAERLGTGFPASWLRRKAGEGVIPRTKVGKHMRFSEQNLLDLVAMFNQPVAGRHLCAARPGGPMR